MNLHPKPPYFAQPLMAMGRTDSQIYVTLACLVVRFWEQDMEVSRAARIDKWASKLEDQAAMQPSAMVD